MRMQGIQGYNTNVNFQGGGAKIGLSARELAAKIAQTRSAHERKSLVAAYQAAKTAEQAAEDPSRFRALG